MVKTLRTDLITLLVLTLCLSGLSEVALSLRAEALEDKPVSTQIGTFYDEWSYDNGGQVWTSFTVLSDGRFLTYVQAHATDDAFQFYIREYSAEGKLLKLHQLPAKFAGYYNSLVLDEGEFITTADFFPLDNFYYAVYTSNSYAANMPKGVAEAVPSLIVDKFDKDWNYIASCDYFGRPFLKSSIVNLQDAKKSGEVESWITASAQSVKCYELDGTLALLAGTTVNASGSDYSGCYDALFIDIATMTDVTNAKTPSGELVYGGIRDATHSAKSDYIGATPSLNRNSPGGGEFLIIKEDASFVLVLWDSQVPGPAPGNLYSWKFWRHTFNPVTGRYDSELLSDYEGYDIDVRLERGWSDNYDAIEVMKPSGLSFHDYYLKHYGVDTNMKFTTELKLQIGNPIMTVGQTELEIDPGRGTTPIGINGRVLLPAKATLNVFGGDATWDRFSDGSTIYRFNLSGGTVSMNVDSGKTVKDAKEIFVRMPPRNNSYDVYDESLGYKAPNPKYPDIKLSDRLGDFANQRVFRSGNDAFVSDTEGSYKLDVMPQVINGRMYFPLGFLSAAFGLDAKYDSATKTVTLKRTLDFFDSSIGYGL